MSEIDFSEAMRRLDAADGMSLGLDAERELLSRLGSPEKSLRFVHVTGTNGKGSVAAFVAGAVSACGYTVGKFASPAVFDRRETIAVDGVWISQRDAADCLGRVLDAADAMRRERGQAPTRFELETAAALLYFALRRCDLVVWEVGLGGRLDATNVVENTLVAAFAPISLDHAAILGGTLASIAREKAGIVKSGCAVVSAPQSEAAAQEIEARAAALGCGLQYAPRAEIVSVDGDKQTLAVGGERYVTRLLGAHQAENLPLALAVAAELRRRGFRMPEERVREGIADTQICGRFERIGTNPAFVLDGAHNPAAARMLAKNLRLCYGNRRIHMIVGIFRDKDIDAILRETLPLAASVYCFDWDHPRAESGEALAAAARALGSRAVCTGGAADAVRAAMAEARAEDCIVAFGSLSHLKSIRDAYWEVKHG